MFDWLIELPRWLIEVAFVVYVVTITGLVVLERRKPTSTLAWILALIFIPVLGVILYLGVGRPRIGRHRRRRQRRALRAIEDTRNMANLDAIPADLAQPRRGLVRLALHTAAAPLRRANTVRLLSTPRSAYEAMSAAIESATEYIHLEFYIWRDDEVGRSITSLLTERARAGVKVRILVDHFGTLGTPTEHFQDLRAAGGQVARFGRPRFGFFLGRGRVNFRNHRKLVSVDGRLGFLGGLNIGDEYLGADDQPRWRDLQMELDGDALVGLEAIFLEDWLATTGEVLDLAGTSPPEAAGTDARKLRHPLPPTGSKRWRKLPDPDRVNPFAPPPDTPMQSAGPLVQVIPSGPDIPVASAVAAQFTAAIATANKRCWVATPYFIPDEPLSLILRTAAMRGVDVRILVPQPSNNDARLAALASRSYYDDFLEAGCRIYEYLPGMLHAKYLIVDHECAAIGSANMDVRSFHINYEITAMFYDASVNGDLAKIFELDQSSSREILTADRLRLPIVSRLLEGFARLLSPLL